MFRSPILDLFVYPRVLLPSGCRSISPSPSFPCSPSRMVLQSPSFPGERVDGGSQETFFGQRESAPLFSLLPSTIKQSPSFLLRLVPPKALHFRGKLVPRLQPSFTFLFARRWFVPAASLPSGFCHVFFLKGFVTPPVTVEVRPLPLAE